MPRTLLSLLLLASLWVLTCEASVNPFTRAIISSRYSGRGLSVVSNDDADINLLVKLKNDITPEFLENRRIDVRIRRGNLAIINVHVSEICTLDSLEELDVVSLPRRLRPHLDKARSASGVNEVHIGRIGDVELVNGGNPFTGKGVLTALFDNGLDPNHLSFRTTDLTASRTKHLWIFDKDAECTEYSEPEIKDFTTDNELAVHGTHTAAIMAGGFRGMGKWCIPSENGSGSIITAPIPYYGSAPDADMVMAGGELTETNIIAGIEKILEYSKTTGRRPVINLSLGTYGGPLDASDFLPEYLNEVGREDAIVVVSAGNEGNSPISISHSFADDPEDVISFFPNKDFSSAETEESFIFVYSHDSNIPDVELLLYGTAENKIVAASQSELNAASSIEFGQQFRGSATLISGVDPANGRGCAVISLNMALKATTGILYMLGLRVRNSGAESVDITSDGTVTFSSCGVDGAKDGDSHLSINALATSENVISVGAFTTRTTWTYLSGLTDYFYSPGETEEGALAPYSSYGLFHDGSTLPTVTAPGDAVISAVNTYFNPGDFSNYCASVVHGDKEYRWDASTGTSMSAPLVSGIIATWLQANPDLRSEDIKKIIVDTSTIDSFVISDPINERWGAGKIDALAGINAILSEKSVLPSVPAESIWDIRKFSQRKYKISYPGTNDIQADIYTIDGVYRGRGVNDGESLVIDFDNFIPGIYIIVMSTPESTKTIKLCVK